MADMMLRDSLSPSTSSSAASYSTAPPSYSSARASRTEDRSASPALLSTLLRRLSVQTGSSTASRPRPPVVDSPPVVGPASLTSEQRRMIKSTMQRDAAAGKRVSAAEAKLRLQRLQNEVNKVNAVTPRKNTAGLFKQACSTDLLFLMDSTSSMQPYFDIAKEQVKTIVRDIKAVFLNEVQVRVAVVAYADHGDRPNIRFLDFTPNTDVVYSFLNGLNASGGGDVAEDVLGGLQQAINASWKQESRCIVHIGDAPPHGRGLHDMPEACDDYIKPGSEPHRLTYEPLLRLLLQLNINYALLRIGDLTDRMAMMFAAMYAAAGADVKLYHSNHYYSYLNDARRTQSSKHKINTELQFQELQLGKSLSAFRSLVVKTATRSATCAATRVVTRHSASVARATGKAAGSVSIGAGAIQRRETPPSAYMSAIKENVNVASARDLCLETASPRWDTPGWLDETLVVEGFCPDVVVHDAGTLNDMMALDENIRLSFTQLTIHVRSRPFANGAMRTASYARTAASTNRFVAKSFIEYGKDLAHLTEDMRSQALCKAFALEFNGLVGAENSVDFVVTTCLQRNPGTDPENDCVSLEPFIEGDYVKYNNNSGYVLDAPDNSFNQTAQAFSHFTFERSWGRFLISDLQGSGRLLTDPAIQTRDPNRFKLIDGNCNAEGFKFFFATHVCNPICRRLELKTNREMVVLNEYEFREQWPGMDRTVCCSNKLCRRIIRLISAHKSDKFIGYHWCNTCWPQLESLTVRSVCLEPGAEHDFDVSRFFYESQGQVVPNKCPEHLEKDPMLSSAAVVGGSLWNRMKSADQKKFVSGRG